MCNIVFPSFPSTALMLIPQALHPPDQETDSRRKKTETQAEIEPRKEGFRNAGDIFERDTQRNHEGDDEVALEAECLPDRFLGAGQRMNPFRILPDNAREHHVEPGEDQYRQRNHPPQLSGLRRDIMPHPGNRDLRSDRRPH